MKEPLETTQESQKDISQRKQQETITGGKSLIIDNRPEIIHQRKVKAVMNSSVTKNPILQKKSNDTGLPQNLKSGIENLSGFSMDDVKVHYNSNKPAQLQAHAYAQGTDIHLAPNQEKHLPHEAWHVVQQKQGRVKPTKQLKSKVNINDNAVLEREADVMGAKAKINISPISSYNKEVKFKNILNNVVQREEAKIVDDKLNIIGESHYENMASLKTYPKWNIEKAKSRRKLEKEFARKKAKGRYFLEREFRASYDNKIYMWADPRFFLFWSDIALIKEKTTHEIVKDKDHLERTLKNIINPMKSISILNGGGGGGGGKRKIEEADYDWCGINNPKEKANKEEQKKMVSDARGLASKLEKLMNKQKNGEIESTDVTIYNGIINGLIYLDEINIGKFEELSELRSDYMHKAGQLEYKTKGIWKIGNNHIKHIKTKYKDKIRYNILTKEEFEPIYKKFKKEIEDEKDEPWSKPPKSKINTKSTQSSNFSLDL